MIDHKKDCSFLEDIKQVEDGGWKSGDGEICGYMDISSEYISFSDGWNPYPTIFFNYCPDCGVKMKNEKKHKINDTKTNAPRLE